MPRGPLRPRCNGGASVEIAFLLAPSSFSGCRNCHKQYYALAKTYHFAGVLHIGCSPDIYLRQGGAPTSAYTPVSTWHIESISTYVNTCPRGLALPRLTYLSRAESVPHTAAPPPIPPNYRQIPGQVDMIQRQPGSGVSDKDRHKHREARAVVLGKQRYHGPLPLRGGEMVQHPGGARPRDRVYFVKANVYRLIIPMKS